MIFTGRPAINLIPAQLTGAISYGANPTILTGTWNREVDKLYTLYRNGIAVKGLEKVSYSTLSNYQYQNVDLGPSLSIGEFVLQGGINKIQSNPIQFQPSQYSDVVEHWDLDTLSTGSSVSLWTGSKAGYTMVQTTGSLMPSKQYNTLNGNYGLEFLLSSSAGQILRSTDISSAVVGHNKITWICVVRDGTTANRGLINFGGGNVDIIQLGVNQGGAGTMGGSTRNGGSTTNFNYIGNEDLVNAKVVTIIFDLAQSARNQIAAVRINGVLQDFTGGTDGVDFPALVAGTLLFGTTSATQTALPYFGDFIWRNETIQDSELISLERYLANKFGIQI